MKKLNNKGLGHHLLIILALVAVIIGAAGYFVWNKQKSSNINAKAADYTYSYVAKPSFGQLYVKPVVALSACSMPKTGGYYDLVVKLESKITGTSKGYVTLGTSNILNLNLPGVGITRYSKTILGTNTVSFGGTFLWKGDSNTKLEGTKSIVKDLIPCDYAQKTANFKYKLYLSSESLESYGGVPGIAFYMCKSKTSNPDFYRIESKIIGSGYLSAHADIFPWPMPEDKRPIKSLDVLEKTTLPNFGWPRPELTISSSIAPTGIYLNSLTNQEYKMFGPLSPTPVKDIPSCN